MGQILKAANDNKPFNLNGTIIMPCIAIPSCRMNYAIQENKEKNILIKVDNGIGDHICAEPSIRWAIENFKGCDISVCSLHPEIFQHLDLKLNCHMDNLAEKDRENYFMFEAIYHPDHLASEFMIHMVSHCVDFTSLNMWRRQLPVDDRNVILVPTLKQKQVAVDIRERDVAIHPGKNWQSKTIPSDFWNTVIAKLIKGKARPVLVGGQNFVDKSQNGTVDIITEGCLDLRDKLSIMETVAVLQATPVVLTNDSGPLHMAASGPACIGFISTVKHPDYITHWRRKGNSVSINEFGYRMRNFSKGGMWEELDFTPNHTYKMIFNECSEEKIRSWLPDPIQYAEWAIRRLGYANG